MDNKDYMQKLRMPLMMKHLIQKAVIKYIRKKQKMDDSKYIRMSIDNQLKKDGVK